MCEYFETYFSFVSLMVNLTSFFGCLRPLFEHKNERPRVNKTVVFSTRDGLVFNQLNLFLNTLYMWEYFYKYFSFVSLMVNLTSFLGCLRPLFGHKNERPRVNKTAVFSTRDEIFVAVFRDMF